MVRFEATATASRGLSDGDWIPAEDLAVHVVDCGPHRLLVPENDGATGAGLAGGDRRFNYLAVLPERRLERLVVGGRRDIADCAPMFNDSGCH